jgi:hypothetical protein
MAGFTAIGDLAESLQKYLKNEMKGELSDVTVTLESPKKLQDKEEKLLSIFFYKILENADMKNANLTIMSGDTEMRTMALDAHFVATPYGPTPESILYIAGRTQQLLNNKVLAGSSLIKALEGTEQSIKITQQPYTQELVTQIWQAMECPMRLGLYYLASPLILEIDPYDANERVLNRQAGQ